MKHASDYYKELARKQPKSVVNDRLQVKDLERVEMRLVNGSGVPLAVYSGGGGVVSTKDLVDELAPNADAIDRLRKLIRDMRAQGIAAAAVSGSYRP
jgi:hypothetical protein